MHGSTFTQKKGVYLMATEFYDPLIWSAGKIAEDYGVSVSDVLGFLLHANRDEQRVREALEASKRSDQAISAHRSGHSFDLVEHARGLLTRPGEAGA